MEIALSDTPLSARILAERLCVPRRSLDQVLFALAGNGILRGVRGGYGGYELALCAHLITVYDVLLTTRSIEGIASPDPGGDNLSELVEKVVLPAVAQAEQTLAADLKSITIDDLIQSSRNLEISPLSVVRAGEASISASAMSGETSSDPVAFVQPVGGNEKPCTSDGGKHHRDEW